MFFIYIFCMGSKLKQQTVKPYTDRVKKSRDVKMLKSACPTFWGEKKWKWGLTVEQFTTHNPQRQASLSINMPINIYIKII